MRRALLALFLTTSLFGCSTTSTTSSNDTADLSASTPTVKYVPVSAKVGIIAKDPAHFPSAASASSTSSNCTLVTDNVLLGFVEEMKGLFTDVVQLRSTAECSDCDAFAMFDSTIQFGSVSGYTAQMTVDFVAKDGKRPLTSIVSSSQAMFDKANASSLGWTLVNTAGLGILTSVTQPIGQQMQCNVMQSRSQTIFNQLLDEVAAKIHADRSLSEVALKGITKKETTAAPAAATTAAAAATEAKSSTEASASTSASTATPVANTPVSPATAKRLGISDKYPDLLKLKELLDKGILTQGEFDAEKAKILSE